MRNMSLVVAWKILFCLVCAFSLGQAETTTNQTITYTAENNSSDFHVTPTIYGSTLSYMFINDVSNFDNSRCPAQSWLQMFKDADVKKVKHTTTRVMKQSYRMMSVGFNKGYDFALWLSVFAPSRVIGSAQWYESLKSVPGMSSVQSLCGSCSECTSPPLHNVTEADEHHIPTVHLTGIDLIKENVDASQSVLTGMKRSPLLTDKLSFDLFHGAAMGPTDKKVIKTAKCDAGANHCRIPSIAEKFTSQVEFEVVPVIDIAELVRKLGVQYLESHLATLHRRRLSPQGISNSPAKVSHPYQVVQMQLHGQRAQTPSKTPLVVSEHPVRHTNKKAPPPPPAVRDNGHVTGQAAAQNAMSEAHAAEARAFLSKKSAFETIDLLHISTGGDEPPILQSAFSLFEARRVRAVMFEYTNSTAWQETSLGEMVHSLGNFNLACHFQGQNRLWALPSSIWNEQYEIRQESQVLCILRSDPWYVAIQSIIVTENTILK